MSRISKVLLLTLFVSAIAVGYQSAGADHQRRGYGYGRVHNYYAPGAVRYHSYYRGYGSTPWYRQSVYPYSHRGGYIIGPSWNGYYHKHHGHNHFGIQTPWGNFQFHDHD